MRQFVVAYGQKARYANLTRVGTVCGEEENLILMIDEKVQFVVIPRAKRALGVLRVAGKNPDSSALRFSE